MRRRPLTVIILLALGLTPLELAPAQQPLPDSAAALVAKADSLRRSRARSALVEALGFYRAAATVYVALGDSKGARRVHNGLGSSFLGLDQPDSALIAYQEMHRLARLDQDREGEAVALTNAGTAFRTLGRPDSAVVYYRRALTVPDVAPDPRGEGATLNNLGLAYQDLGRMDSALAVYRRALSLKRSVHDSMGEAIVLFNLAGTLDDMGQADSSLVYQRSALGLRQQLGDRYGQSSSLNRLGIVYRRLGQPDSALEYFGQALALARAIANRGMMGVILNNFSNVLKDQGRLDSALVVSKAALELRREIGNRRGEAITANNIGELYLLRGVPDSAIVYLRLAFTLAREVRNPASEAIALNNLGVAFSGARLPDSAEAAWKASLTLARAVKDPRTEADALTSFAQATRAQGKLDIALALYDSAAAVRSFIRAQAGRDANRVSVGEVFGQLYQDWAVTWLARASTDSSPTRAVLSALAASERGKAQALLALMRDSISTDRPGTDLAVEGERLIRSVTRDGAAGLYYLATPDTLHLWIVPPSGEVALVSRAFPSEKLAQLAAELHRAFDSEAGPTLLAARGVRLEPEEAQGNELTLRARRPWREPVAELATILLPPEALDRLSEVKEIVVVPHGPLALVPFATLPVGPRGDPFGSRYALRYAVSLATLEQTEMRPVAVVTSSGNAGLDRALVVGNPAMPDVMSVEGSRDQLSSLPGAEAESHEVAGLLRASGLSGTAAGETEIRRRLAGAPIVHFATHGFAYSSAARARNSFIAFAPDSSNDGLLTVGEILDDSTIAVSSDLVVLSACQTGLGDLKQAEGTIGLQRAFLAKGARSVLVSLWRVSDAATRKLLTGFYRHWLQDADRPSKAEALRRSQEEVRKTPGWEHPRFWAAFQLVGAR